MSTPFGAKPSAISTPPTASPAPGVSAQSFSKDERVHTFSLSFLISNAANSISIATRAADSFTKLYYSAYDAPTRLNDLPNFYRATSSLSWNGTQKQGVEGLKELITNMPPTDHDVKSFDCHPIPGTTCMPPVQLSLFINIPGTSPPSLLLTVSGNVTHGRGPSANPSTTRTIEGHARVFSQTFMLLPDPESSSSAVGEVAKYFISADAFRFVG